MLAKAYAYHNYSVYGMHCSLCLKKLKTLPSNIPGLHDIVIDMSRQTLKAEVESSFESDEFIQAVQRLGFEARELKIDEEREAHEKRKKNNHLAKLGVAGALAGNIMLLSYAVYLGAPKEFSHIFIGISGLLYFPVLFYAATPFYGASWSAIKNQKPSIDLPLTLAITLGSLLSYLNLFRGNENVYFDSLAALVFLLLASRFLVQRLQVKYLSPISLQDIFPAHEFTKIKDSHESRVSGSDIEPGDRLRICNGQVIPADAILVSESALFDNSLITGESEPVELKKWAQVYGGTRCISNAVEIEITETQKKSRIGAILENLNMALNKDSSIVELTDSFANYFTMGVFGIGLVFFIFYSFVSLSEATNRVLALFVIACPCALAVTTPLILRLSTKRALKNNFLVKKTDIFEKLTKSDVIVFDKTGTLTPSSLGGNIWSPRGPNEQESSIILSLEKKSQHPVAKAILRSLGAETVEEKSLKLIQEQVGVGVSGNLFGDEFSIKKSVTTAGDIGFFKNNELILSFKTQSELRPEVKSEILALQKLGLETYMLTGDNKENTERVLRDSGLPVENIYSDLSPEQKEDFIKNISKEKNIIYVGDGMNDVLAMANGLVGISMQQSVEATFSASSIHIIKDGIKGLSGLYKQAKQTVNTIKILLGISVIYNSIFGTLALLGLVTPLVAAILMPLSSVSLVLIGMYRTREEAL